MKVSIHIVDIDSDFNIIDEYHYSNTDWDNGNLMEWLYGNIIHGELKQIKDIVESNFNKNNMKGLDIKNIIKNNEIFIESILFVFKNNVLQYYYDINPVKNSDQLRYVRYDGSAMHPTYG